MSPTLIYGLIVALLVLGPLIILHEFGHYILARFHRIKVLEFGFGFPPRMFGIWSGSTLATFSRATSWEEDFSIDDIHVGDMVTVLGHEDDDGLIDALKMRRFESNDIAFAQSSATAFVGKVKSIDPNGLTIADMIWSINWLPLGGFVKLRGEEDPAAKNSLAGKSALARFSVIIAGVAVNAVLPFIIFMFVVMMPVERLVGDVVVANVMPDSPAYEAGIRPLQKIIAVDGQRINSFNELQSAVVRKLGEESKWEVQRGIPDPFARPTDPEVHYLEGDTKTVVLVPRWDPPRHDVVLEVDDPSTQMRLGEARVYNPTVGINNDLRVVAESAVDNSLYEISISDARRFLPAVQLGETVRITDEDDGTGIYYLEARKFNSDLGSVTYLQEGAAGVQLQLLNQRVEAHGVPIVSAIPEGIKETFRVMILARNTIIGTVSGSKNPQFEGPVAVGPVGLSQLSGEVATADIPVTSRVTIILTLAATLSMSLAVINLLPIPGLDGGRLAFVFLEVVRGGKRVSPERENLVHLVGFVLLIALIAVISFSDIARLVGGERFL